MSLRGYPAPAKEGMGSLPPSLGTPHTVPRVTSHPRAVKSVDDVLEGGQVFIVPMDDPESSE